jgi:hypothetical protein
MQEKIIQALTLVSNERRLRKARTGPAVNFGQSRRGIICRLHGSRTFTGYGATPADALAEAIGELLRSARQTPGVHRPRKAGGRP